MENNFEKFESNFERKERLPETRNDVFKKEDLDYKKAEEELSSMFQGEKKGIEAEEEIKEDPRIEELLVLSFEKGEEAAVKKAESFNDPFLLDAFHDRLAEEIKKRKL